MKKLIKIIALFTVPVLSLLNPVAVSAVCPVCTVAVVGGLGLSRFLGIDDSVSGVWVGGLLLSLSFWLTDWVNKKGYLKKILSKKPFNKINNNGLVFISFALFYLITFIPMFTTNFIGHPVNKLLGVDKLVFGSIVGTVAFVAGVYADAKVRKIKGKQLFQFQKVVFPVIALLISSAILYLITK